MKADLNVAIMGAGIGGLAAAKALQRKGAHVEVFEKVPRLMPVGSGITLQSNAMQALAHIGLADVVRTAGSIMQRAKFTLKNGRTLSELNMEALAESLGQPSVCIHRGQLQQLLIEAVDEEFIHTGVELEAWTDQGDGVQLELSDGARRRFDVLIGADGLRSNLRSQLWGNLPLRPVDHSAWRGICPNDGLVELGEAVESWGAGQRFGYLPIDHTQIYWFATDSSPTKDTRSAEPNQLAERFRGWAQPVFEILQKTHTENIVHTEIFDLRPFAPWGKGRVTLLGDAAHAMTPNFGQGGCQAIEDAVVLAEQIGEIGSRISNSGDGVSQSLRRYEQLRHRRTKPIVRDSRLFGRLAQGRTWWLRLIRNAMFSLTPNFVTEKRMRQLLTFSM